MTPARRARRAAILGVALTACASAAACTLLVDFKDVPAGDDASIAVDSGSPIPDAGHDVVDAAPVDTADARPCIRGDAALTNGWYCAGNGTGYWPGSKDTLFRCEAGVATATECDGGCVFFRTGVPDRCDPCPGRKSGKYCGPEIGWDSGARDEELVKFLVECQNGELLAGALECTNACVVATHTCN